MARSTPSGRTRRGGGTRPWRAVMGGTLLAVPLLAGVLATAQPWRDPEPRTWAFDLVDPRGEPVSNDDFPASHLLVYFGYTACPDICPTTLAAVAQAIDLLPSEVRADLRVLFISVDPERDRGARLADYVGLFHPDILGLTGTPAAVRQAAEAFGVVYRKAGLDQGEDAYSVDHTSALFLITPDRRLSLLLSSDLSPDTLAERIASRVGGGAAAD